MKIERFKHFSFLLLLISIAISSVRADNVVDMNNMSGKAVNVLKTYPGEWKGWTDGCVNCGKPLASDKVRTKSKKKPLVSAEREDTKKLSKSVHRGYCECNCIPRAEKKTSIKSLDSEDESTEGKGLKKESKSTEKEGAKGGSIH